MGFETILESLVAVLLIGTIAYAAILNRKLNVLRQGREEFETLVRDLNRAIERAEKGTVEFRKLSDASATRLDGMVKDAQVLRDDLGYLIDRGAALADDLSGSIRARRASAPAHPAPGADDVVESLYPDPPPADQSEVDEESSLFEEDALPRETQEKLKKLINSLR